MDVCDHDTNFQQWKSARSHGTGDIEACLERLVELLRSPRHSLERRRVRVQRRVRARLRALEQLALDAPRTGRCVQELPYELLSDEVKNTVGPQTQDEDPQLQDATTAPGRNP